MSFLKQLMADFFSITHSRENKKNLFTQGICFKQQKKRQANAQNKPYCNLFVQEMMKAGETQLAVTC